MAGEPTTPGGPAGAQGARVPPWSARVARQPTILLHASCGPWVTLDSFTAAARRHGFAPRRVQGGVRATRGMRGGGLLAEMLQLGALLPIHRVEVVATVVTVMAEGDGRAGVGVPGAEAAVRVTCAAGARELRVATRVARLLDDVARSIEAGGATVRVAGWYATPEDAVDG